MSEPAAPNQPVDRDPAPHPAPGRGIGDAVLLWSARASGVLILLMLAALLFVLVRASLPAMQKFGAGFLVSTEWRPNEREVPKLGPDGKVVIEDGETVMQTLPAEFGAAPVIWGTLMSSLIALLIAVPLSFGAALFIVRVAPRLGLAGPLSFLIEFLASIPSIAYGMWGLFVLSPFLQRVVEPAFARMLGDVPGFGWMFTQTVELASGKVQRPIALTGRDALCGGLILAIMILPIITAISRDVLKNVPRGQIEGTLALGATWWQSCWGMLKYSRSGLFGAVMLGLARASGETMAVAMVIGNNNQIELSPFAPAQTMASLLANEFREASSELHRSSLLYVALILLVMSLTFNIVARQLVVGKGARTAAAH
ncbi:MAG: phosphate ABC transporter permease subunit PstC [Phycisphaerales bacterium]|nr:phosphate ABC transporter permease subunit PstC [Phycisphaerales bacterium]